MIVRSETISSLMARVADHKFKDLPQGGNLRQ
jgi:hypothetical protein